MSRASVLGPNSLFSFTKFGSFPIQKQRLAAARESSLYGPSAGMSSGNRRLKELFRLENQKHIRNDLTRERRYRFCVQCGTTTVTVNFNNVPSARVGLWGRCVDNKDYTHHRFADLSQEEYMKLRDWPTEKRLNWWRYGENA